MRFNIGRRLFILITLILVFAIGASMLIFVKNFKNILLDRAIQDQTGIILKGASDIGDITHELDSVTLYLYRDSYLPQILENAPVSDIDSANLSAKLSAGLSVYTNFPITGASIDYYSALFVHEYFSAVKSPNYTNLGKYLLSNSRSYTAVFSASDAKEEFWYQKTLAYNSKVYCFLLEDAQEFIFFSKLVRNGNFKKPSHDDVLGVLVLAVKKSDIVKILTSAKATEGSEMILVYDDIVLAGTRQSAALSGQSIPEKFTPVRQLKNDGQLHQIKDGNTKYIAMRSQLLWDLNVMTMIPERDITKPLDKLILIIVLQMLFVLSVALLISAFISTFFTKPIVHLAKSMKKISSEEQLVELEQKQFRKDEISYLYSSYNSLIRRIQQLVSDIKKTMTLQKKSELKALQAQINPHFIYNSLDTINWIALYEGQKDISTIVTSLVDIFRYSIKDSDTLVTLDEEIYHLEKYLQIQNMRYIGKFTFKMDVPDAFLKYSLPKLTIQPLVENSLFHAINSHDIVRIRLSVEHNASGFHILVSDTGKLADPESINEYLRGSNNLKSSGEQIGIRNLDKRIKMHFGDDYGLKYRRSDGELSAILCLPPLADFSE